jgi:hypothetical protein
MRLGLRANIWLVTPKTFEAAKRGDWENCAPCEDKTSVDLDKDWHAIHYLLTGDTKSTFLHTGVQLAGVDEHYELHSPQDVAALHSRLSATSASALMSTFDAKKFDELEIYPRGWVTSIAVLTPPDAAEANAGSDKWLRAHIEDLLAQFIALVERAAQKGLGICVTIA